MLKFKDQLLHNEVPVFTRLCMETPLNEALQLPPGACYLYVADGDNHALARVPALTATKGTAIISACGLTVGNIISENLKGYMETTIAHFSIDLLQVCFDNEKPELWEELTTPVTEYVVQTAASELVAFYFSHINQLFENKVAVTNQLLRLKLKELVLLLLQTESAGPVRQIVNSLFSEKTFTFKEVVDAHVLTRATVHNLAQLTGTSLSTFKRKFKELYEASPAQYLLQKRLDKVAEQVRITDEPIGQIGYQYGFESPEHLSRTFKKQFGQTPSAYRLNQTVK